MTVLDLRCLREARELHALWQLAYRQEAALLGAPRFAPLQRTVADLRAGNERYCGARRGGALAGAIGWEGETGTHRLRIASLVVHPDHQRRGIGRRLLAEVLSRNNGSELIACTAVGNGPALRLYAQAGFIERRRWFVDGGAIELIELRRAPSGSTVAGKP